MSSMLSGGGLVGLSGFGFQTSQNALLNSAFFDWNWRFGDHRSNGDSFYTAEESIAPIYFDFGIQFGGTYAIQEDGILLGEYSGLGPLVRPNIRLGINAAEVFGGKLSANIRYFYLFDHFSASLIDDEWREIFEIKLEFGSKDRKLTLSASGGANPSSGFELDTPKYKAGVTVKF
ncbi:MAG: hypothetical protein KF836_07235 [Fimbriimonadaceae bacterium]|nr:hypothetical protein [Fimbriimonadaceae bacterium]